MCPPHYSMWCVINPWGSEAIIKTHYCILNHVSSIRRNKLIVIIIVGYTNLVLHRGPRLCLHGIFKFLKAKGAQSRQYRHVIYRWKPQNPSFHLNRGTRTCIRVHGSGVLDTIYIQPLACSKSFKFDF